MIHIIGIGNAYRGDDGVGPIVTHYLRTYLEHATIYEASGEGAELMELWKGVETVFLIDAVASGGEPGTIYRFEAHAAPLPAQFFHYSTHQFSVAEAIELARVFGELPSRLIIYGIEGNTFDFGAPLSVAVEQSAHQVVERICAECRELRTQCMNLP